MIRTGVVLPTFRDTPDDAFDAAAQAYAAGVDGVFCYDHIWPMGEPDRPALAPFPILAALATSTDAAAATGDGPFFGTLVARVGLVPNGVLVSQFRALEHVAPGRIIAGLGTGDRLSEAENRAYGVPYPSAAERRAAMVEVGRALRDEGLTVWMAGGPKGRTVEAREAGVAMNLWDADAALVATRGHGPEAVEVTWGGPPPTSDAELHQIVGTLARAGATWVIFGWPVNLVALAEAAQEASSASEA